MADLSDVSSAQSIKVIGSDSSGVEQTPVQSTPNGGLHTNLRNNAGIEVGTSSNPIRIDPTNATITQVEGNIASGISDSGNPVKVGGKYSSTVPLLSDNYRGDNQLDENSNLIVSQNYIHYTAQQRCFSATTAASLTVGTSETPIFLFKNPNTSGIKSRIFKAYLNITGGVIYRFYHTPTITTNGTALTAINQRIMTSPIAALCTPYQSPTVSANGTLMWQYASTAQGGTDDMIFEHQFILNPNFNLLITAQAGANNTAITATLFWYEVT